VAGTGNGLTRHRASSRPYRHVYELIKDGQLIAIRVGRRALRISEASLNRFIEAGKVDPREFVIPKSTKERR